MSAPLRVAHRHQPVYRVVRAGWEDPLDASFSQRAPDNRWNGAAYPALYCCCSERVARAIVRDLFAHAGVELADLQPSYRPAFVEIGWTGEVVDVASREGVEAARFPEDYPDGVSRLQTRKAAADWHRDGAEGVLCRSASLWRRGFPDWSGPHLPWAELVLFVANCQRRPQLRRRREAAGWPS
jgi:RES domain-containing protein